MFRSGLVEKKRLSGVDHVAAQLVPGIRLGENVFRQALCAVATVGFLDSFKHQIAHILHDDMNHKRVKRWTSNQYPVATHFFDHKLRK